MQALLLFVLPLAAALPWDGPAPTQALTEGVFNVAGGGWSPAPTPNPIDVLLGGEELRRRQTGVNATAAASLTSFSYATCGFLSGSTSNPYTCYARSATCAQDTVHNVFGCCYTPSLCNMPTTCVPQTKLTSCADDAACGQDLFLTKCNAEYPFCNQNILSGRGSPATAWYCDSIPAIAVLQATATDGSKGTVSLANVDMTIPSISSTTASSTSTDPAATTTISSTATPAPTPTPANKSSTPVGAIAGGAVGGVAVLAAIGAAIFVICIRGRKKKESPVAPTSEVPYVSPPPPPPADYKSPAVPTVSGYYPSQEPVEKDSFSPQNLSPNPNHYSGDSRPISPELYSAPGSPQSGFTTLNQGAAPYPYTPYNPQQQQQHQYPNVAEVEGDAVHHNTGPAYR